ncbi:MAG: hypothetical protein KF857_10120 [Fimbriimonadaceae bacterium]|nr:hypothetical protein [Fimbriimonadaceae bacterium]
MSAAFKRFRDSMVMDYEKWHDGTGYDLDAIAEFDDQDRRDCEAVLVPRAGQDWRDLEALERLGTPKAVEAILRVRQSPDPETRLRAHDYGPAPTQAEWDAVLAYAWPHVEPFSGLTVAQRCSIDHPSKAVVQAIWKQVRQPSKNAYHAAETLCLIAGVIAHEFDFTYRDTFLALEHAKGPEREAAVAQTEALCREGLRAYE